MKRYYDLNLKTDNNFCDDIDLSYMVEIPNDGKPYGEVNNEIIDISKTPDYIAEQEAKAKAIREQEIKEELKELDFKRIRALAEGGEKEEGKTWLQHYNEQAIALRAELEE